MIISPCISICRTDPKTGYCYGCGRSNDEKKIWKAEDTTDDWKDNNIKEIRSRLIRKLNFLSTILSTMSTKSQHMCFYCNVLKSVDLQVVGRKGLEPSHVAILVPKTNASTNSAIAPQNLGVLYIIQFICPMTIIMKFI